MSSPPRHRSRPTVRSSLLALSAVVAMGLPVAAAVTVSAPDVGVLHGTSVSVPVSLGGVTTEEIVSVEVFVSFDTSILTYTGLDLGGHLTEPWAGFMESNLVDGGVVDTLKIAAATVLDTIDASGVLFELGFDVADLRDPASSPLTLELVSLNEAAPAGGIIDGSVSVVGVDGTIDGTPNPVEFDQTVTITIDDADEDRTGVADSLPVTVTNGTDVENLTAVETGPATGQFEVSIPVVFSGVPIPGDLTIQGIVEDEVSLCYDDVLDASGATVPVCDLVLVEGGTDGVVKATIVAAPGDTVHVRLEDRDLNLDPAGIDSAAVTVLHSSTAEEEAVLLVETGPNTEVFYGRVYTAFGATAGAPGDTVMIIQKADTLFVRYDDSHTAAGPPASFPDTVVVVNPFGDASGNGTLRALDAFMMLEHWVGNITLAGLDSMAANLDAQAPFSAIDDVDASLLLQLRVALIDRFPVQGPDADNHPQPETGNAVPKGIPDERPLIFVRDAAGYIALRAADRDGIVSAQFVFADDFEGRIEAGAGVEGFMLAVGSRRPGEVRVALAGGFPLSGEGELLRLYPAHGQVPRLQTIRFNGGDMVGIAPPPPAASVTPLQYRLHPNIPNPFNPETVIPYQVDRAETVRLQIYNELGQLVRTLHDGRLLPGSYRAVWHGRDDNGDEVAGGTYFYRLHSPTRTDVGKMILLK